MSQGSAQKRRSRGRRKGSRDDKINRKSQIAGISSLKEQKHRINMMTAVEAEEIHKAVLKVLWEFGVLVEHAEVKKTLIDGHGCREDEKGYVRFPPDLVSQALSTLPNAVKLYDLNGNLKVDTSSKLTAYCPGHNCVRILDHETGKLRQCSLDDIRRTAVVCRNLDNIAMTCSLGYPSDVPAEDEAFETAKTLFEHCPKPAAVLAHDDEIQTRIVNHLATLVGGLDNLAEKPVAIELMGPISPLKLPQDFCQRLINAARLYLPVVCYPATFPGMSSPISAAGAIAQSSAEAIAGVVVHQLTQPGAPVVSGSAVLPMDMRQADLAYGGPEYMTTGLGAADYFKHIGLPSWIGAGCSDSHDFDAQAAAEGGANMAIAAMASTPFVHNLGYLSGGRTGSLEMLTLCDELVGWTNQVAAGCKIDADSIAIDVITRAAVENSYLTDEHTQQRYLTENWYPTLFERSDADAWMERGSHDMRSRIRERLAEFLR